MSVALGAVVLVEVLEHVHPSHPGHQTLEHIPHPVQTLVDLHWDIVVILLVGGGAVGEYT